MVICRVVKRGFQAVVYLDFKSREKRDNGLEYLLREANFDVPYSVKAVEVIDSKKSDLMQLCDLYTGLVRFGFLQGHVVKKNFSCSMTPTNRKEEFFRDFHRLFCGMSGKRQKVAVRTWEWRPKKNPAKRWLESRKKMRGATP
jgi:hypothetical protein